MAVTQEQFLRYVSPLDSGCWLWTGYQDRCGYGRAGTQGLAHRLAYQLFVGEIPDGLTIDHLCHNADSACEGGIACPHRACVNPEHMEPVTNRMNSLRGKGFAALNAAKTHCAQGHPYDAANTYIHVAPGQIHRNCRTCNRAAVARRTARLRVAEDAIGRTA